MVAKTLLAAALISIVSAHQNLHQIWINDKTPGYQVGIRMPPSNSPVTDVTSNDIACNVGGSKVPSGVKTIDANEGDTVKVQWDQSGHPGPITHMMYGPVDDASQATGIGAGWFKIDELDYVGGKWANEIMQAANMTHEFKLPKGLASGDYLLRSEMLALHASQTLGGGQFYIGVVQLKVKGTGSKGACGPTIKLPGAYKKEDANIYIPNFYNGFNPTNYKAPGGPIATCGGSSSGSTDTTPVVPTTKPESPIATLAPSAIVSAAATPAASSATSATPTASTAPSTGAGGEAPSDNLPATFTLKTFITWLENKAAGTTGKVRRHARAF